MRIKKPKNHWGTPRGLKAELTACYNLDPEFDPCPMNCDLSKFNGLKVPWPERTFCNPPYDLAGKTRFVMKAFEEAQSGKVVVLLLPVSTSTKLFHEIIYPHGNIKFLTYRPKYEGINSKGEWCNPMAADISTETRQQMGMFEGSPLEQVSRPGAHDAMVVIFRFH
jgi:hypothetical protein